MFCICQILEKKWEYNETVHQPLLYNFALEYAIRKVQENQMGLKLNETYLSAADVNLVDDNISTIKINKGSLIDNCEEVGLEVNTEKTT
jgi:hypothetical protein